MPPSPSLSARRMKTTYLIETIKVSDQNTSEMTPYTSSGVGFTTPLSIANTVCMAYRGLVPMSPNTTPMAPSARPMRLPWCTAGWAGLPRSARGAGATGVAPAGAASADPGFDTASFLAVISGSVHDRADSHRREPAAQSGKWSTVPIRLRPPVLAEYIAASAWRTKVCAERPSSAEDAMPMLALRSYAPLGSR